MDVKRAFFGKGIQRKNALYWFEGGAASILQNNWKGYLTTEGQFELYNIKKDQSELKDIKMDQPEVADKMELELKDWLKNIEN